VIACAIVAAFGPRPTAAASTWQLNLYNRYGVVYQDPYPTACAAAAAMMMLNFTALAHTGGDAYRWTSYRVQHSSSPTNYRDMTSILYFERTHDTLSSRSSGTDAHGWRNAMNYYGWGSTVMRDASLRVYDDLQFNTFTAAVKSAVRAIARYRMPVGILGWAGHHAQVMTGYVVTGANPANSTDFTVNNVYLTDPLRSDGYVNAKISASAFQTGNLHYRFRAYREADSPYDDGYSPGWKRSSVLPSVSTSEWYRRWVIIAPIRSGPGSGPSQTPSPTPTPTPAPTDTPAP
jgi:hypothetical protein